MTDIKKQLELRKKLKKKKPSFRRQESHVRKRLPSSWRRPRGVHSKMRRRRAGKCKRVSAGYGSLAAVRGLTEDGLQPIKVNSIADIGKISKGQAGILSSSLGRRKRLLLLEAAKKAGLSFLNVKDVGAELLKIKNAVEKQKLEKKKKLDAKKKKKKLFGKKEKKAEEEPAIEEKKEAKVEEKKLEIKSEKKEEKRNTEKRPAKKESKPQVEKGMNKKE